MSLSNWELCLLLLFASSVTFAIVHLIIYLSGHAGIKCVSENFLNLLLFLLNRIDLDINRTSKNLVRDPGTISDSEQITIT